jgi:beta-glucosidase
MKRLSLIVLVLVSGLLLVSCTKKANLEQRVEQLLAQMTLEEKADMLSGTGFESKPLQRLGIPAMKMTDGPLGVRRDKATAFPAGVAMAATWNPELIGQVGKAIAQEVKAKKLNVLLGPCINIHRTPFGGRNFESYGEDPYLTSRMAVAYIKGMQDENVIATVKHYAVNNQETDRFTVNAKVDERALREIYLPAFRAAVTEGGVWAVMGAYNRLNGPYCCANKWLLTDVLKNEWGFKGIVMSDWGAVHDVDSTLNAGCDLEMPGGQFLIKDNVLKAVKEGRVDEKTINDKIRRMLRAMLVMGLFDSTKADTSALDSPRHRALALKVAQESAILLKNASGFLPLDKSKIKKMAVIGPNAAEAATGGGGSSIVRPFYTVSPLEGLKKKFGDKVEILYARGVPEEVDMTPIDSSSFVPPNAKQGEHGLLGEYFNNEEFKGKPVLKRLDAQIRFYWGDGSPDLLVPKDHFSIRWTGSLVPAESGAFTIGIGSDDGSRVYFNGTRLIDNWGKHSIMFKTASVQLKAGKAYPIKVEMYEGVGGAGVFLSWKKVAVPKNDPMHEAVEAAKGADAALVFAGTSRRYESEGFDRPDLALSNSQDKLIKAVIEANPNTVVVMNSGASISMNEWIDKVPSVVQVWFPGQEGGNAIADILFGDVNPSGKLPTTFLRKWEDSPAYGNFPGSKGNVEYKEGIFVGYRYFDRRSVLADKKNIEPLFPFGHGLSYTTFEYGDLDIIPEKVNINDKIQVQFTLLNTGKVAGAEVIQLYIGDEEASVERPVKELKAFKKVFLKSGEKQVVSLTLDKKALSFYDVNRKDWVAEPGRFNVMIGSSSRDIRLQGEFELE